MFKTISLPRYMVLKVKLISLMGLVEVDDVCIFNIFYIVVTNPSK